MPQHMLTVSLFHSRHIETLYEKKYTQHCSLKRFESGLKKKIEEKKKHNENGDSEQPSFIHSSDGSEIKR